MPKGSYSKTGGKPKPSSFGSDWAQNTYSGKALDAVSGGALGRAAAKADRMAAIKKPVKKADGGLVIMVGGGGKGSCKPKEAESESEDMEEEDDDMESSAPTKKAKGGMVNKPKKLAKTPIQIKGWGKARKG